MSPSHLPRNYHHLLSSQNTNSGEETTTPRAQPEPRGPKNARQWQTTATKISSNQMRINEGAFDGTIEFIDRISEDPEERVNESPTPKVKRIQTTNLPIGAFGSHENLDFTSPIPPSARSQYRGKIPLERTVIPKRVVLPNKRQRFFNDGNVRHIQLERTQHFNYAPKQRTVQPEVVIPVTVAPKAKPRYLPNPPKPQQIFHDAKLVSTTQPPPTRPPPPPPSLPPPPPPQLIQVPVTLPPQPPNRAPEDAAFLAEIEEYDWRLYYKQQALENSPPKANPLNGFSRVHGSPQSGSTSLNNDYEDIEAIKNREHFTDNPPQKSFTLPSSIVTSPPENEVLVPFNNAKGKLSANKINVGGQAPVAHSIGTGRNSAPANVGNNFQGPTGYQGVTPNPLFGNFFNLFNLNGQVNVFKFIDILIGKISE